MRRIATLLLACALALACAAPALAAEEASDAARLSNRYESINNLDSSFDTTDQVVTGTTIGVLTSVNRALDGATVSFTGEAVGDIINGGDGHKWVTLLGASGASIGVYMDEEDAAKVANLGSYSTTGTTLEVRGVYSVACAEHQGELDVHATEVRVVDAGGSVTHAADRSELWQGIAATAAGFALLLLFYVLRRRWPREEDRR